jgi:hypothetical protein
MPGKRTCGAHIYSPQFAGLFAKIVAKGYSRVWLLAR